jgi:hypothetical protein
MTQAIKPKNRKDRRRILGRFKRWKIGLKNCNQKGAFGKPHNDIIRKYSIEKNKEKEEKRKKR